LGFKGYGGIDREERPFNFAQLLLERTDRRFEEANQSRINGDINMWYRILTSILTSISFVEDMKTSDKTEDAIGKVEKQLKSVRAKIRTQQRQKQNEEVFYFDIEEALNDVEKSLIKLMYKHGLYYPKYDIRPWEEVAEDEPT